MKPSVPPMQRSRMPIWSLESHLYSRFRHCPCGRFCEDQDTSVMGTEIPLVEYDKQLQTRLPMLTIAPEFLLLGKSCLRKGKRALIQLAGIENAAIRLAANIKKTQKRANALKNITIPRYEALTKDIQNALEEKEREEFTRLKVIKRMKQKG